MISWCISFEFSIVKLTKAQQLIQSECGADIARQTVQHSYEIKTQFVTFRQIS